VNLSPETCRADLKRSVSGICCILLVAYIVDLVTISPMERKKMRKECVFCRTHFVRRDVSHEMCATKEIWEACWHASRPELHVRSRDVSRVDRSVSLRHNSMLNVPTTLVTSHELTWREDSVSPALQSPLHGDCYIVVPCTVRVHLDSASCRLHYFVLKKEKKKKRIHFPHVSTIFLGQGNDETRDCIILSMKSFLTIITVTLGHSCNMGRRGR
jgi:hypothetical protein